ncbi:hypothetical protein CHS0354_039420 [Potamilus streckersoni]|uniref:Uncharacterized protein n=1 Tax=Potamilus streckersoni TaxID=2493646 RepID=A0AAE0S1P3_9BIVA|nr:hypothetical protein CHS0354_039420 [Potamilus streckersoni]
MCGKPSWACGTELTIEWKQTEISTIREIAEMGERSVPLSDKAPGRAVISQKEYALSAAQDEILGENKQRDDRYLAVCFTIG